MTECVVTLNVQGDGERLVFECPRNPLGPERVEFDVEERSSVADGGVRYTFFVPSLEVDYSVTCWPGAMQKERTAEVGVVSGRRKGRYAYRWSGFEVRDEKGMDVGVADFLVAED
jgi:hypothetical protein